jgi:cold shock CspA family protein
MTSGVVTKLVKSFGSEWGRIRISTTGIDCFFNRSSLLSPADFDALTLGQEVTFDSRPDMVNGSHAEHLTILGSPSKSAKATL